MTRTHRTHHDSSCSQTPAKGVERLLVYLLIALMLFPVSSAAAFAGPDSEEPAYDTATSPPPLPADTVPADDEAFLEAKTILIDPDSPYGLDGKIEFNPDPTRAVWLSALFPGLGQIYNRRYWKLPIVVGAFMGLGYGTSWNNGQYQDYSRAYRDLLDSDPSTKSYMDFFPPTVSEADLDTSWLTSVMKSRRDYYRRNRDLCIICMVGVYLLCMVDAYVDAQLSHFDITPDLSMDVAPAVMINQTSLRPNLGLNWALTF